MRTTKNSKANSRTDIRLDTLPEVSNKSSSITNKTKTKQNKKHSLEDSVKPRPIARVHVCVRVHTHSFVLTQCMLSCGPVRTPTVQARGEKSAEEYVALSCLEKAFSILPMLSRPLGPSEDPEKWLGPKVPRGDSGSSFGCPSRSLKLG